MLNFGSSARALDAAIQGHGVAIVPTFMIEAEIHAGHLKQIWHPSAPSGEFLVLFWARHHERDTSLRQTVSWVSRNSG
ncbi:LysR substrate-binding domain-containing protein [Sulfitobacter sp. EhC04]|uniref:LysR substrate-binding domain-containing protein n=1 Tax=Sulfitobacter sp. EhC04 TaxID=1849168 RepID=UPI003FCD64BF